MKRGFSGEVKCESAELKGFSIPRKPKNASGTLITVPHGTIEERDLLLDVQKTAIDSAYHKLWKVRFVKLLNNPTLENNYCDKRRELKLQINRPAVEELVFSVETLYDFEQLLQEGQCVKPCEHSLGNPQMGISLFRHIDVALRFAKYMECGSPVEVVVYKVFLGRPKLVHPRKSASDGFLDPTPNYDSHVSSIKPTNTDKIFDLLGRSTVYLYEYDDQAIPVSHPRQCIPIAVVSFNNFTMPYLGSKIKCLLGTDNISPWTQMENKLKQLYQSVTNNPLNTQHQYGDEATIASVAKTECQNGGMKGIKCKPKKEIQMEVNKATKKKAVQKESKSGLKKESKNEGKKESKNGGKKESKNEGKKEAHDTKKEALKNEAKNEDKKKDIKREAIRKETKCGSFKNQTKHGVSKEILKLITKEIRIVLKKETICVKAESASSTEKLLNSSQDSKGKLKVGKSEKHSESHLEVEFNNQSKQCDIINEEIKSLPSEVHTTVKTARKLPALRESNNSSGDFLKRLLQEEFLRRRKELLSKLANSKAELDEDSRLLLETSVRFNTNSDKSGDSKAFSQEGKFFEDQHSSSISNHAKKRKVVRTLEERPAILSKSDKKTETITSEENTETFSRTEEEPETFRRTQEEPDTFSRTEEEPETFSRTEEEPETFSRTEEEPDTFSRTEEEPDTFSRTEDEPDTFSRTVEEPDTFSRTEEEPETFSRTEEEPETFSRTEEEPETFSRTEEEPETFSRTEEEPETFSRTEEEPETFSRTEEEPETFSRTEEEPETYSRSDEEPETYCRSEKKPNTYSRSDEEPETNSGPEEELETFDRSQKATTMETCSVNSLNGIQHEGDVEAEQAPLLTEDFQDIKGVSKTSVLNARAFISTVGKGCIVTTNVRNEQSKDRLGFEMKDNSGLFQASTQTVDLGFSDINNKDTDTRRNNDTVKMKLSHASIESQEEKQDDYKSVKSTSRSSRPSSFSRNPSSSRTHFRRNREDFKRSSRKDCSWQMRDKYQTSHRNKASRLLRVSTNTDQVLMPKNEKEERWAKTKDDEHARTQTPQTKQNNKLSHAEALEKLHHLLQQTGHCDIDFTTIMDVLTGKILTKVSGSTASETTGTDSVQDISRTMQMGDVGSKFPKEIAKQTALKVESQSNHGDPRGLSKNKAEDFVSSGVKQACSSTEQMKTQTHIKETLLTDPRLQATQNLSKELLNKSGKDTKLPPTAPKSILETDRENGTESVIRASVSRLNGKETRKKPELRKSDSKSSLSCPAGSAPRVKCNRPLTCPFYSLVPSTFVWKVETIDLAHNSVSVLEHDLTANDEEKPKFNGRTLLKGGVDPRIIPLEKKDSIVLELVDPRKKNLSKTPKNIELRCQTSVSSESGSCMSIGSVDSGVADMDLSETVGSSIIVSSILARKQNIPTDGLDDVTKRITDIINDTNKEGIKCSERVPSESVSEISPTLDYGTGLRHYIATTKVVSMGLSNQGKGEIMCRNVDQNEQSPDIRGKLTTIPDCCSSLSGATTQSPDHSKGNLHADDGFPISVHVTVSGGKLEGIIDKAKRQQTDALVDYSNKNVTPSGDVFQTSNERNVDVSRNELPFVLAKKERSPVDNSSESSARALPEGYQNSATPQFEIRQFGHCSQNSFVPGPSNVIRYRQNCYRQNNITFPFPNPCFSTQSVVNGFSAVLQPTAGEFRAENYLANSPFVFSSYAPLPPVNVTTLSHDGFDARQRINELRCSKLICNEFSPGNIYPTAVSLNCFNDSSGLKRPLSGASDGSSGKRFRSSNIDFDDVLNRIQAASTVATTTTKLPRVMPRYDR